jgi:predicted phosphate transport protein (TIGR00153 family)
MAKGDKFYFENFAESTALSKKAASYLVKCLENYDPDSIEKMLEEMHEIEHSADKKKHEMNEALAKAFVTPVDREDLDMLSHNLDQVTDKIEEILQKFYIYNIQEVELSAIEFAKKIVKSCDLLCALMDEFENFKRSKKIRDLIIEMNDVEEECDKLYLSSMRALTQKRFDVLTTISLRKIYDCFESCADACEHVSECVGTVIMKNT